VTEHEQRRRAARLLAKDPHAFGFVCVTVEIEEVADA